MTENFNGFEFEEPEAPQKQPGSNKTFIIVASILGGLFLIALIVMAVYVLLILPRNKSQREAETAKINAANTATVAFLTQEARNQELKLTLSAPTATATKMPTTKPTNTLVVVNATNTPEGTPDPKSATVAAILTQTEGAKLTATFLATTTALPKTGFIEDVGIPGLLGITIALLVVIFLVRRLRVNPA